MPWLIRELQNLDLYLGITLHSEDHFNILSRSSSSLNIRALSLYIFGERDSFLIPHSFFNRRTEIFLNELSFHKMLARVVVVENIGHYQLRNLEHLSFDAMVRLENIIWKGSTQQSFPRLHTLQISRCCKLGDISWTYYLRSLRRLHLIGCESLFQLINREKMESTDDIFPSLTHLVLIDLRALKLISEEPIMFPSLEYICIQACPMLRMLPFNSNTIPSKLTTIKAARVLWEQLEWEDDDLRTRLEPLFEEIWWFSFWFD